MHSTGIQPRVLPHSQSLGASELASAKRRLAAVLADPAMRLADLAAEVARQPGGEASETRERAVQESLHRMLSRSGGAMKVRGSCLGTVPRPGRLACAAAADQVHALWKTLPTIGSRRLRLTPALPDAGAHLWAHHRPAGAVAVWV